MLVKFVCLLLTLNLAIQVSKEMEFNRKRNQNKSFSRRMSQRFTVTSRSSRVTRKIRLLQMSKCPSWRRQWMDRRMKSSTVSKAWTILEMSWSSHMSTIQRRLTTDLARKRTSSSRSCRALQANGLLRRGLWIMFTINLQLSSILQQSFKESRQLSAGKTIVEFVCKSVCDVFSFRTLREPCNEQIYPSTNFRYICWQEYLIIKLLALHNGGAVYDESFYYPSHCSCRLVKVTRRSRKITQRSNKVPIVYV